MPDRCGRVFISCHPPALPCHSVTSHSSPCSPDIESHAENVPKPVGSDQMAQSTRRPPGGLLKKTPANKFVTNHWQCYDDLVIKTRGTE
ncbi:MAG: hypothetical protein CVV64_18890 [Candidatus Wallbacteria bacterium HGW-Wallbacteria-1]|uniref:Uncharacterized protein n=1 Tax=Candidatus Wallbacteria bacterium HGW-Wallbacteria-1 TaxID=2013854 RepID=A0A2N1PJA7_9BACT|nr:MAG: hypothetical protein CVV64_18890 [Candidatus Wallbacteria bacterium HGW-Wallbacteria-1]